MGKLLKFGDADLILYETCQRAALFAQECCLEGTLSGLVPPFIGMPVPAVSAPLVTGLLVLARTHPAASVIALAATSLLILLRVKTPPENITERDEVDCVETMGRIAYEHGHKRLIESQLFQKNPRVYKRAPAGHRRTRWKPPEILPGPGDGKRKCL